MDIGSLVERNISRTEDNLQCLKNVNGDAKLMQLNKACNSCQITKHFPEPQKHYENGPLSSRGETAKVNKICDAEIVCEELPPKEKRNTFNGESDALSNGIIKNTHEKTKTCHIPNVRDRRNCEASNMESKTCQILNSLKVLNTGNVTRLLLPNCNLKELPPNIPNMELIFEVDLSNNELEDLPDTFLNFKKLRIMNFSNNHFKSIPKVFFEGLFFIKSLNFSSNKLLKFDRPPKCLPLLQYLNLSSNSLYVPPAWLMDEVLTCLEMIDLSYNKCFEFYTDINSFSKEKVADRVQTLKLINCGLKDRHLKYVMNFSNLKNLQIGNLVGNKRDMLNRITDIKYIQEQITDLSLCDTAIGSLPKSVTTLKFLRSLDISRNSIQWLPVDVRNLRNLIVLRAENSKMFLLPTEMNELVSLQELHMSHNELSTSESFEDLVNLRVLDLYANQFIAMPNLSKLGKLESFDICQNFIEPPGRFEVDGKEYNYEELKYNLRLKLQDGRKNGSQEFQVVSDTESFPRTQSDYEDSGEEEFENQATYTDFSRWVPTLNDNEVWDLDSDELFEPNASVDLGDPQQKRAENAHRLSGETPYEVMTHPHFFAPFRNLSPVSSAHREPLPPPIEGQFDD